VKCLGNLWRKDVRPLGARPHASAPKSSGLVRIAMKRCVGAKHKRGARLTPQHAPGSGHHAGPKPVHPNRWATLPRRKTRSAPRHCRGDGFQQRHGRRTGAGGGVCGWRRGVATATLHRPAPVSIGARAGGHSIERANSPSSGPAGRRTPEPGSRRLKPNSARFSAYQAGTPRRMSRALHARPTAGRSKRTGRGARRRWLPLRDRCRADRKCPRQS